MTDKTGHPSESEGGYGWLYEDTPERRRRGLMTVQCLLDIAQKLADHPDAGASADVAHQVALNVFAAFFGRAWVNRHLVPNGGADVGFIRANATDDEGFNHYLLRVIGLAEMLFNFQRKPGLEGPLENLRGGQIEAAYAELEVAKLLSNYDIGFRFVTPEGRRGGKTHDLEFFHPNGERCSGETKCKVETTDLTDTTILSTLKSARTQLPKDGSGVIFLKVPQTWMETDGFRDRFASLAQRVLGASNRLVSIVAYSAIVHFRTDTGGIEAGLIGREVRNPTRDDGKDWRLLDLYEDDRPLLPRGWVSFTDLFPNGA